MFLRTFGSRRPPTDPLRALDFQAKESVDKLIKLPKHDSNP
jgi:hypothetical protein